MINEYLFRLALVVNTSHSKFNDNLSNIVVYILYEDERDSLSISEITDKIQLVLGLEFTEKEVLAAINTRSDLFFQNKDRYILTDHGQSKIHSDKSDEMRKVITLFKEKNKINLSVEELSEIIYKFLYACLNQNIELLLNVIQGKKDDLPETEHLSNEQRKIVNDFLDWDNVEKNNLLVQLISFSVDYCRLTVKKDSNNFRTLLNGKKFYLDANIFFRMMGVNNIERKISTLKFIDKCKECHVQLCYTSVTRQEMLESINYHVNEVKNLLRGYRGSGKAINNLYNKMSHENGFVTMYLKWCKDTNTQGEYEEFKHFLKQEFFKCAQNITLEEIRMSGDIEQVLIDSYMCAKDNRIREENAVYDIKNVKYVDYKRKSSNSRIGWNINDYMISADHKLVDWSMNTFDSINPIVVLPSVWYSLMLKITGRVNEEEKSFIEFIKMRYSQDLPEHNVKYLISTVCRKTSNGELQDMLFDEISSNNAEVNKISFSMNEAEIEPLVDKTYDDILNRTKQDGYEEGKRVGSKEAYSEGENKGYEIGCQKGERIGILKQKREDLLNAASIRAVKKQRWHIFYVAIVLVISVIGIYFITNKMSGEEQKAFVEQYKLWIYLLPSGLLTGLTGFLFTLDIEKIKKNENAKIEADLRSIDNEIESLQKIL